MSNSVRVKWKDLCLKVKYCLLRYLYGFEEYCRSANIQFRTIHHHEPKVKQEKKDLEEPMEEALNVDREMPSVAVKSEPEENADANSESEREEVELKSPRVSAELLLYLVYLKTLMDIFRHTREYCNPCFLF